MDLERVLVSKLVFTGQIEAALSRNINSDHFYDDECRDMFEYLVHYARRYKCTPSLEVVKHDRPDFEWIQIEEPIEWAIDRFSIQVKRNMANSMLEELAAAADDRERAEQIDIEFLQVAQNLITALPHGKVDRLSEVYKRINAYDERKKTGKSQGVPYGYPTLDRVTGGVQKHQLVTVLAFTNVGKSTLLRSFAHNFWLGGYTPLFFSLEMDAEEILHAFDAMSSGINFQKIRQLQLDDDDMQDWRAWAKSVKQRECDIPVIDSLFRMTPDQVYAEMLRYRPDVAIIDYVGLMRSSQQTKGVKRFQQISDITQDLKIIARMLRIPIIMAAQTNRGGAKDGAELEHVADSIGIAQDSDVVIGLFQDEDMERDQEMEIRVNKNRGGKRPKFKAIWRHETQEFREKTMRDLMGGGGRK